MRVTLARILAATTLTAGVALAGTVAPAHATAARVSLMTPSVEMCDTSDPAGLCMNRSQGGLSIGTSVISFASGDNNDDFEYVYLFDMCGGVGKVTLSCPFFGNAAINQKFHGSVLIAVEGGVDHTLFDQFCLGLNGTLYSCPDPQGVCHQSDGCTATIFAAVGCTQLYACTTAQLLNRYWTVKNAAASWAKIPIQERQNIIVGASSPQNITELPG